MLGIHAALFRQPAAFLQIAAAAGSNNIFPHRAAAFRFRHHMIECEIRRGPVISAILARKTIAQKHVESREGWITRRCDIFFKCNDAWQTHFHAGRMHHAVILGENVDAAQKHRLDGILPGPERKREVTQRAEIGVEDEGGAILRRWRQSRTLSPGPAMHSPGIKIILARSN